MKFKKGDKVKIIPSRCQEYWDDVDNDQEESWCKEAPQLFKYGRVFTITGISDDDEYHRYFLDNGAGGSWSGRHLVTANVFAEDLFTL
jgi:hypothetical protein